MGDTVGQPGHQATVRTRRDDQQPLKPNCTKFASQRIPQLLDDWMGDVVPGLKSKAKLQAFPPT
jgi:hypothetical protein